MIETRAKHEKDKGERRTRETQNKRPGLKNKIESQEEHTSSFSYKEYGDDEEERNKEQKEKQ